MRIPLAVAALLVNVAASLVAQSAPTWTLQLDHAIRPAEGTPGVLGDVAYLAVTKNGVVYVAERKAPRVTRYDAKGAFGGVIMREGAGPREVRAPEIVLQGDTLVVFDPRLSRVSRIAPSGSLLSEHPAEVSATGFPIWTSRDGAIWIDALFRAATTNQAAVRISTNGHVDTVAWNERNEDQQWINWTLPTAVIKGGPFSAAPSAAIDPEGHVVVGGSRASRWLVMAGKDTVRRVELRDHLIAIPKAIRDSAWDAFLVKVKDVPGSATGLKKEQLPTTLPAWLTLDINPRGEWWIGRPGMDGRLASWDIVTNGKIVGHVVAPSHLIQGGGIYGRAFGADLMALLQEDENGLPWIGVYRVVRALR